MCHNHIFTIITNRSCLDILEALLFGSLAIIIAYLAEFGFGRFLSISRIVSSLV